MNHIEVTILGSNSAIPANGRHPSSHWISIHHDDVLMDCGEATQFQILRFHKKPSRLSVICISHLHGDHCFGLPGLLTTMSLAGRTRSLVIIGPKGIQRWLNDTFALSGGGPMFDIEFRELETSDPVTEWDFVDYLIKTFPLKHRIPTFGFVFHKKAPSLPLNGEKADKDQVPLKARAALKNGKDYTGPEGTFKWQDYTGERLPSVSYAYCSDTIYDQEVVEYIKGVDLLYHEATYDISLEKQAAERFHSTAAQAGKIAKFAGVKHLLIGHCSSRYKDTQILEKEAQEVFPNSTFVVEGASYSTRIN